MPPRHQRERQLRLCLSGEVAGFLRPSARSEQHGLASCLQSPAAREGKLVPQRNSALPAKTEIVWGPKSLRQFRQALLAWLLHLHFPSAAVSSGGRAARPGPAESRQAVAAPHAGQQAVHGAWSGNCGARVSCRSFPGLTVPSNCALGELLWLFSFLPRVCARGGCRSPPKQRTAPGE